MDLRRQHYLYLERAGMSGAPLAETAPGVTRHGDGRWPAHSGAAPRGSKSSLRTAEPAAALAVLVPDSLASPTEATEATEATVLDGITPLPITGEIRDGYQRESYPRWKDVDRNGCGARIICTVGSN